MNETFNSKSDSSDLAIKLRMDVDYAYPSRLKSFFFMILNTKVENSYLKNAKIIAQMVNESTRKVRAYWFFTPYTLPDEDMLALMRKDRHEAALHVAVDPYRELEQLEKATNQRVVYFTIHGTERFLAQILWRRKPFQTRAIIPEGFPLDDFWTTFDTVRLDLDVYSKSKDKALEIAKQGVAEGKVLHVHPEWLFKPGGRINRRGPYYDSLKMILGVDEELTKLVTRKKKFFTMAQYAIYSMEFRRDFTPTDVFLKKLADRDVDVFTFIERAWAAPATSINENSWAKARDNVGILAVKTYNEWLTLIGKKTRNMIRKAEKSGVQTAVVEPSEQLAEGIWKIYNETPVRQERAFPYYGISLEKVRGSVFLEREGSHVGAFLNKELIGFIYLAYGGSTAVIEQILSLQEHSDKAVNNALIAKAVEVCASRQVGWLMYGRMGNHPSLDSFKENNGFAKFSFPRYYVPLTRKGRIAMRIGLHKEFKDSLPEALKSPLFPVFNWVSRTKQRMRLRLFSKD